MSKQELRAVAIQKSLSLSKRDALKVLVFITEIQAENRLPFAEKRQEKTGANGLPERMV